MEAQKETPLYETPVLTLKAIAEKMAIMDKEVNLSIVKNCHSIFADNVDCNSER